MKAVCVGLSLAVCLLIVKGQDFSVKYEVWFYFLGTCRDPKLEDFLEFGLLVEKCDKELIKLEEIIRDFIDDKEDTVKVFRKFCEFYPEFSGSTEGVFNFLKKCMNSNARNIVDIFGMLPQFMCSKNGKLGTAFIAEDGVNCVNRTSNKIEDCIKSTGYFTETNKPICSDLGEIRKCVRTNMETCSSKIPANIFEAFFKITKEKLQCKN